MPLDSVQKNRLTTHIRGLIQTPEWRDIKRFITAASADPNSNEVNVVAEEIQSALVDAVQHDKDQAIKLRGNPGHYQK